MLQNYVLNEANEAQVPTSPVRGNASGISGLPLGQTDDGEIYLKVGGPFGNGGDVPISDGGVSVQHTFVALTAGTYDIPAGAKEWTFVILTGTALIGGEVTVPAPFSESSSQTSANGFQITMNASSTGYLRINT